MDGLSHVLGLAAIGITVVSTGAALAVLYVVFSPACSDEIEHERRDVV